SLPRVQSWPSAPGHRVAGGCSFPGREAVSRQVYRFAVAPEGHYHAGKGARPGQEAAAEALKGGIPEPIARCWSARMSARRTGRPATPRGVPEDEALVIAWRRDNTYMPDICRGKRRERLQFGARHFRLHPSSTSLPVVRLERKTMCPSPPRGR